MKSPKEFLSNGMRLEDFLSFLYRLLYSIFRVRFFRVKQLGNKFIIFVVYLWFVVANENSLLWVTFFNGVSNVRCEDVEHYFGIIIAIETFKMNICDSDWKKKSLYNHTSFACQYQGKSINFSTYIKLYAIYNSSQLILVVKS